MQETRHILQFSEISGERRNPSTIEDGKFPRYNNTTGKFDYVCVGDGGSSDINLSFFTTLITNILEGIGTDTYLSSINRVGNSGQFTMSNGTNLYLPLGALAWEDSVEATLTLPGNTKVLYDNNDEIGGSANFTYNYILNRLQLDSAPIMFKTGRETYKEGLKYLGNYSWSIGNGVNSIQSGSYNFTGGYKAGYGLGSTSLRNLVLGPYAGELACNDLEGSVFIGPYAGRYENESNKFFLDNADYSDTATARTNSFLYADLDVERRLYIRDRLSVEKEGKFGTSGLSDAEGEYGMHQMSAASGGNPQWHDGTEWKDYANSINTYLNYYDLDGTDLTLILSDLSEVGPIDLSGINTITFATSPSSPSTGQTATSNYGYIQISNSSFTNNEGFTYKAGLRWADTTKELFIPGAANIGVLTSDSGLSNTSVWSDGDHAYIKLNGTSIQIDNEELPEEGIDGVNIGGATYEVFKQRTDDNLEFRTFQSMPIGTNNPNDRIKMAYSITGDAIFIGTTAERNRLDTVVDSAYNDAALDRDNSGETLLMKALRPGNDITFTVTEEYIQIDAVGAAGGEVNLMNNNGTGLEFYAAKNGVQFEMYTLSTSDSRISLGQATDYTTDPENTINLDLGFVSADAALVGAGEASLKATITGTGVTGDLYTFTHKKLTSPLSSITIAETATEIQIESGSAAATGTNLGAGVDIYVDSSAPAFKFKRLNGTGLNGHIDISPNEDNKTIDFSVDDITVNFLGTGTGEQLFEANADGWTIDLLGLDVAATSGLTLNTVSGNLVIDQPIPIPYFKETVSGILDSVNTESTTSKINYSFTYDSDYRDGDDSLPTKFFELNLGSGLSYDSATNTLNSNFSSGGSVTDNFLTYADIKDSTLTLKVGTALDDDAIAIYSLDIPTYTLPVAESTNYTGATGSIGGVKVDEFIASWVLGYNITLDLDTATGKLSSNKLIVTYEEQNYLHDEDNLGATFDIPPVTKLNINTLREQARANIGSAYVNGKVDEDFTAKDLVVEETLTAEDTTVTHTIGGVTISKTGSKTLISVSDSENLIIQSTNGYGGGAGGKIEFGSDGLSLYMQATPSGSIQKIFFKNAAGVKKMVLDGNGNLYVSGNIFANADIQALAGKNL